MASRFLVILPAMALAALSGEPARAVKDRAAPMAATVADRDVLALVSIGFAPNVGQADRDVRFVTVGPGLSASLTADAGLIVDVPRASDRSAEPDPPPAERVRPRSSERVALDLKGARRQRGVTTLEELPGKANYFKGSDAKDWHTKVPTYGRVRYDDIYPGIDVVYYGAHGRVESDFIVSPGADASSIEWRAPDHPLRIDADGGLVAGSDDVHLRLRQPVAYQEIKGRRVPVDARYVMTAEGTARLQVGVYDRQQPLVVDPIVDTLVIDYISTLTSDGHGGLYVDGVIWTPSYSKALYRIDSASGTITMSVTIAGQFYIAGIGVDVFGNITVAGGSWAQEGLPIVNAIQPTCHGGSYFNSSCEDGYVARFDATGSTIQFATFLGGSHRDGVTAAAVDQYGGVYLVGFTLSTDDFPLKQPIPTTCPGSAFVTKLGPTGTMLWSTFLGACVGFSYPYYLVPEITSVAVVDDLGLVIGGNVPGKQFPIVHAAIATPASTFAAKIYADGHAYQWATYLGDGSVGAVGADSAGHAYVVGAATSGSFPTTPGATKRQCGTDGACDGTSDAFVARFDYDGHLEASTLLGGAGPETATGVLTRPDDTVWVTGTTHSGAGTPFNPTGFPQVGFGAIGEIQRAAPYAYRVFLAQFSMDLTRIQRSMLTGQTTTQASGWPIALAADGADVFASWRWDMVISQLGVLARVRPTNRTSTLFDFDGDGRADPAYASVFTMGLEPLFSWLNSSGRSSWTGSLGFLFDTSVSRVPVPADYDGDGRTDFGVWDPPSGLWTITGQAESNPTLPVVPLQFTFGASGDIPLALDFDGDGLPDPSVWRPTDGRWYVMLSSTNYQSWTSYLWGVDGDVPVAADYDGDGVADFAIWRPSAGQWWVLTSSSHFTAVLQMTWGIAGDIPVPGDYDGDGHADVAIWRPSDGQWWILTSSSGYLTNFHRQWGVPTHVPVPADYDGDGKTDMAVWQSDGTWWVLTSSSNFTLPYKQTFSSWAGSVPLAARR